MTLHVPIIDELIAAPDDAARARWLLQVPAGLLYSDHLEIKAVLQSAGFSAGLAALSAEIASLCATRDRLGRVPTMIRFSLELARVDLETVAYGGRA